MTRVLPGQAYLENMFGLCGRRALITGSSQGIGLALARGLARAGANVVLNGRDPARLEQARKTLAAEQPEAETRTLTFDATSHEDVRAAIDEFEAQVSPIDILVNNAGMQYRTPLEDFPADRLETLLQTNIASVFHVGQAAAWHLRIRRSRDNARFRAAAHLGAHQPLRDGRTGRQNDPGPGLEGRDLGPALVDLKARIKVRRSTQGRG